MSENLEEILNFDPLSQAERETGKSYKEDALTSDLGLAYHMLHAQRKEEALKQMGDTRLGMNLQEVLDVYTRLGFEEVYLHAFPAPGSGRPETYRLLWQPRLAILASVESYATERVNAHKIYFNARYIDSHPTASGHVNREAYEYDDKIWIGDKDAREGLAHFIRMFEQDGEFICPWVEVPHLYLLTYAESRRIDHTRGLNWWEDIREITRKRLAALPEWVRFAMGVDEDGR